MNFYEYFKRKQKKINFLFEKNTKKIIIDFSLYFVLKWIINIVYKINFFWKIKVEKT
jgi:hypothetical protein